MSSRAKVILCIAVIIGFVVSATIGYRFGRREVARALRPPELGGQDVPEAIHEVRSDRAYDLHCHFDAPITFLGCKILGVTGRSQGAVGTRDRSFLSDASSYQDRRLFEHWLVLEQPDGRLAFLPPGSVRYLEESAAKKDAEAQLRASHEAR